MKKYNAILVGNGTMGKRHRARFEMCGVHFEEVLDTEAHEFLSQNNICKGDIDFAVIASPASSHYEFAKYFLERGIHTFVEKPLATSVAHTKELATLAVKNNAILFVAMSECYNPIFLNFRRKFLRKLYMHIASENSCNGVHLEFRREHGYTKRCRDVDVSLDLLVHDLAMFLTMFDYGSMQVVKCARNNDRTEMQLQIVKGKFKGLAADFIADRNSAKDVRTISVSIPKTAVSPAAEYSLSLVHYEPSGNVMHIPDSLDNEHSFFLKLIAGACKDFASRVAENATQVVELATRESF